MHITSDDIKHLLGSSKEVFRRIVRLHTNYFLDSENHAQGVWGVAIGVIYTVLLIDKLGWIALLATPVMLLLGLYTTFILYGALAVMLFICYIPFWIAQSLLTSLKKWADAEPKSKKKN